MAIEGHPEIGMIAGIGLMRSMPSAVLDEAAKLARTRELSAGERIFDQGEPAGRAHALVSGCVGISQTGSDGEEILVRFVGAGEIFGCVPILTDRLYPADATVVADSIEVSWDPADLLALMQRHSGIACNMIAIVGQRLVEAQERIRELATQSADRRVAHILLRLAGQAGDQTDAGVRIGFPLRRKDVADIAGTTLHTVSRILADWERRGLLASPGRHLTLSRPEVIRRIAEGTAG